KVRWNAVMIRSTSAPRRSLSIDEKIGEAGPSGGGIGCPSDAGPAVREFPSRIPTYKVAPSSANADGPSGLFPGKPGPDGRPSIKVLRTPDRSTIEMRPVFG